ncbi:cobalt ECF transporter T component CbiQ [Chamaesiphon sp. VAR_48_metabat_135_sub]|uniref:cobalt ECF transporter T component CbiQ n=1 Tax=Chamaesiphon sp. VAR_48_metabat_135_sub TaxID=2964699 RepID=UPI00286A80B0|nr:cobalt ECF transporter T component CbiQ [Chamaesiphon sp. VAR_48_metabat_135_sub]
MHIQLDTLAYSNRLRHLPPSQKLYFALVVLLLALITHYPVQIFIFVWMSVWSVVYAGIPRQVYSSMIAGVLVFLVTSMPALAIEYTRFISPDIRADSLWQMSVWVGQIYLSRQGLIQAIEVLVRSLASTSALFFIVLTIPAIDLAMTFKRIGCPPILIELSLLVYRFIFLLANTAQQIVTAQVSRGGYRTHRLRLNSLNLLVRQLIRRTASRYQQSILGVTARGFQQEFRFWQPQSYQYSQRYALESIVGCLVLIIGEVLYRL